MLYSILEWVSTSFSLVFLWLLIRRKIYCWPFGIISSLLSIALFIHVKLYSEAILYFFYVVFGFYGWYSWKQSVSNDNSSRVNIEHLSFRYLAVISLIITALGLMLGYSWKTYSDASYPYIDAQTTIFALFATWLEAKRIYECWYYWIILNIASVIIYSLKSLPVYATLMIVYSIMSLYGLWKWKNSQKEIN